MGANVRQASCSPQWVRAAIQERSHGRQRSRPHHASRGRHRGESRTLRQAATQCLEIAVHDQADEIEIGDTMSAAF